jgi:hypothetical protein
MILVNIRCEPGELRLTRLEKDFSATRRGEGQRKQKSKAFIGTRFVPDQRQDWFRQAE